MGSSPGKERMVCMKTSLTLQLRAFPVRIQDTRSWEERTDTVVLDKSQLQAAQLVGQSSKELIHRMYSRQGFRVLSTGKPERREVCLSLDRLFLERG